MPFSTLLRPAMLLAGFACACWPFEARAGAVWRQPVEVVYDAANSPLPDTDVAAALQYAVAAWGARIDLSMAVVDAKPGASYEIGRIVVRWVDSLEQVRSGANILGLASTRRWTWASTQTIAGAEIYLHAGSQRLRNGGACFRHALLHEVGHALGINHLPDPAALMHEGLGECHHTLTIADISAAPYPQYACHAELLPGADIYIPALRIGGRAYAGRLHYDGTAWTLADYHETSARPTCHDTRLEDGKLILDKLWSPQRTWHAVLIPDGTGAWHLLHAM